MRTIQMKTVSTNLFYLYVVLLITGCASTPVTTSRYELAPVTTSPGFASVTKSPGLAADEQLPGLTRSGSMTLRRHLQPMPPSKLKLAEK